MDELLHRVPALQEAEVRQMVNGPESFTPDGHPILGEAPEVEKLCMLCTHTRAGITQVIGLCIQGFPNKTVTTSKPICDWI